MRFQDQIAIVSGAASGMGLRSAERLAAEGAQVVLTDANEAAAVAAAERICAAGGRALGLPVDVRRYDQIAAAVERGEREFGPIDLLINCAGGASSRVVGRPVPWHEQDIDVIEWGLDVNLKGAVLCARAVFGGMLARRRGVILSLGSVDGVTGSHCVDYGAAKRGIVGLTKSLALLGAPRGVRANCVSPGPVLTRPEMANMATRLGRAAAPDEIVTMILYLCSDDAAFVTGQNFVIDGGRSVGAME
ncbi:MAG: SDR family oxidoreductase [Fimbriimonadaceae bacterium]|nr:SDR family oxidoreductase [Fimbriimonadaceae bacterium]